MRRGILAVAPSPEDFAALAAEVSDVRARLAALEARDVEQRRRRFHRGDEGFLTAFLPRLSGAWGPDENYVRDVLDYPALARFARGKGLVTTTPKGDDVKRLAAVFRRAAGVPIGAYVLVDCGVDPVARVHRFRVDGVSRGLEPGQALRASRESTAL